MGTLTIIEQELASQERAALSAESPNARKDVVAPSAPPTLSIVIPFTGRMSELRRCLDALLSQPRPGSIEVVVVDRTGQATLRRLTSERRIATKMALRVIATPRATSIPQMRQLGSLHARGGHVAILEDHVVPSPTWMTAVLDAIADGHPVIAGPLENGCADRLIDRVAFLVEYGAFHLDGVFEPETIPGNNAAYTKTLLLNSDTAMAPPWDCALHQRLRQRGVSFRGLPAMRVTHCQSRSAASYLSQRFHHGRSFAAMRTGSWPLLSRMGYAFATVALPLLLMARWLRVVKNHPAFRSDLPLSVPVAFCVFVAGAFGEALGAAFGAGASDWRVGEL